MVNAEAASEMSIVLLGNPNTGKTTLFNALTGLRHRVGNYPGVTVETKTGQTKHGDMVLNVTDVPGTYSLSPRSPDEMLTVDLLLGHRRETPRPDVIVCIADASNLERNLYLATQAFDLGRPVVIALNMMDVAKSRGIAIDVERLSADLGVPVVPIQANSKHNLTALLDAIVKARGSAPPTLKPEFPATFSAAVADLNGFLTNGVQSKNGTASAELYLLQRALLDTGGQTEKTLIERHGSRVIAELERLRTRLNAEGCSAPAVEPRTRYAWIAKTARPAIVKPTERRATVSDRVDRIVLHRVWGVLIFLAVMALVFQSIFSWATPVMDAIKSGFDGLANFAGAHFPEGALKQLLMQGVIKGVGNVLAFLPQIAILFGFLAILEDCGYMARAAFLMDKLMSRCGLSGKSFIPMLSSFACAIPGVMATRTIEDRRDRLTTILVAPLMSCSARLPVYALLIAAFVPVGALLNIDFNLFGLNVQFGLFGRQAMTLLAMYMIGLVVAPLVAWLLKRTLLKGETPIFLMELPSYKLPSLQTVLHRMVERSWAFCQRAGTLILATTIVIWALQYYPRPVSVEIPFAAEQAELEKRTTAGEQTEELATAVKSLESRIASAYQQQSILGRIGHWIEPAVRPLGWDWRIGMAAIASFPAREVIVSALGTIYSVGADVESDSDELQSALHAATWPDGRPVFSLAVALSLMVFFALCCQCAATLAVIKRETNSWRWPIFTFVYMTGLAYVAAFVTFQVASRI